MHPKSLLGDFPNDLLSDNHCILDLILIVLPSILKREFVAKRLALRVHIIGKTNKEVRWRGKLLLVSVFVMHREHELFQLYNSFIDCVCP